MACGVVFYWSINVKENLNSCLVCHYQFLDCSGKSSKIYCLRFTSFTVCQHVGGAALNNIRVVAQHVSPICTLPLRKNEEGQVFFIPLFLVCLRSMTEKIKFLWL